MGASTLFGKALFGQRPRTITAATDAPTRADTEQKGGTLLVNRASSGAVTITINVDIFHAGDKISVLNVGGGTVTIAAGASTTARKATGLTAFTLGQYQRATIEFITANEFVVSGNLPTS